MMKKDRRPLLLKNAPLQYAPSNELGVVFLFADVAKRLQFRIEQIQAAYPDCTAYRLAGDTERRVRIEFEFRSSSFKAHGHNPAQCDCIVCWHHDWPEAPRSIEVIELKRFFGVSLKVWIQVFLRDQWPWLDGKQGSPLSFSLSSRVTPGDLLLMYRSSPLSGITDVFRYSGSRLRVGHISGREGKRYFGRVERLCKLDAPVFLDDMRQHHVLKTASFVRASMQGGPKQVSEYWPYLYSMIVERNTHSRRALAQFAPEQL